MPPRETSTHAVSGLTAASVTVNNLDTQRAGVSFTVTGTFTLTQKAWATDFESGDDKTTPTNIAAVKIGAPEPCKFSFVHPGYKTPGNYTLTVVVLGAKATSNKFQVVK